MCAALGCSKPAGEPTKDPAPVAAPPVAAVPPPPASASAPVLGRKGALARAGSDDEAVDVEDDGSAGDDDTAVAEGSAVTPAPAPGPTRAPPPAPPRAGNRLYVGNLSPSTSRETVEAVFASEGEVKDVTMPIDRDTGQPRGFAFVTMGSAMAASGAIAHLNGTMIDGRSIKIGEAQERAVGGGFGRGSGLTGGGGSGGGSRGGGGRERF
ncbi:MAG: RNA-binding protein [Myxococcales bacterium]|nr:RNA-binding protein [Myxococcales bacterium]